MFYFVANIMLHLILLFILYHYLSYRHSRMTITDLLLMLFSLNTYFVFIIKDINVIISLLFTILIILIKELYEYLYKISNKEVAVDCVLINRGNINFHALINNKYSYNRLIKNLHRKGIYDIAEVDYCALYNNDLLIFKSKIKNYPISLIIDGKVIDDHLKYLKKDDEWLNIKLSEENMILKDVSYAFYKNDKIYFLTNV